MTKREQSKTRLTGLVTKLDIKESRQQNKSLSPTFIKLNTIQFFVQITASLDFNHRRWATNRWKYDIDNILERVFNFLIWQQQIYSLKTATV